MTAYQLIFEGQIQKGNDPEVVRRNLAALFDVPVSEVDSLFSGAPVVLKDGLDLATARRDKTAFEATGAICRLAVQPGRMGTSADDPNAAARNGESPTGAADAERQTGARRYGLGHSYLLSFFHKPFYRDVARHWRGLAFVHLLILLALTGAAFMLHFKTLATVFVNEQAPAILAQIPPIAIEKGTVRTSVDQPYRIYRDGGASLFAVIDTTGEITSLGQTEAMLLLTRSQLMARIGSSGRRVIDLRPIDQLELTRDDIAQWLQTSLTWAPVILFPLMLFFSFCLRTVQVLIYGGIGVVASMLWKRPLPFGATVALSIMAMTPVILIDTLIMVLTLDVPYWGTGSFVVALGYLLFGIRAATEAP